jgi:MFS family permease
MLGGFMAVLMDKTRLRFYFMITSVGYSLVMGIAGAMVILCHQMTLSGELVYIGMFGIYGIFSSAFYVANTEFAISWMPQWPGFAGGIHGMSVGVGSVIMPQIIIWLRSWFTSSHINVGTIFFCLGIFKLILSIPWLPFVVSRPCQNNSPDNNQLSGSKSGMELTKQFVKNYRLWPLSFACFAGFLPILGIMAVQEPVLRTLWHEPHAPISTLALILMGCFMASRVLCPLYSDKIGMKQVWCITLLAQAIFLSCLGVLVLEPMDNSLKLLRVAVLCLYFAIFPAFKSTMAGVSHDVFGAQYRLLGSGALSMVSGVAGIIGPLTIDLIHTHFNDYSKFFFGSAALSAVGALAMVAVHLLGSPHEAADRASEDNVDS